MASSSKCASTTTADISMDGVNPGEISDVTADTAVKDSLNLLDEDPLAGFFENLFGTKVTFTCKDIVGDEGSEDSIFDLLVTVINVVKIVVPIILIALGILDFLQALLAQDDGGLKKAQGKFIKRLIVGAIIFLAPSIIRLLLTVAHTIWPQVISDDVFCGIIK